MKRKLPFVFEKIGRGWDSKNEIDILASDSNNIILGECKFKNSAVSIFDFKRLKEKYNTNKNVFYYIFSKSGFDNSFKDVQREENLKLMEISDLFKN